MPDDVERDYYIEVWLGPYPDIWTGWHEATSPAAALEKMLVSLETQHGVERDKAVYWTIKKGPKPL